MTIKIKFDDDAFRRWQRDLERNLEKPIRVPGGVSESAAAREVEREMRRRGLPIDRQSALNIVREGRKAQREE